MKRELTWRSADARRAHAPWKSVSSGGIRESRLHPGLASFARSTPADVFCAAPRRVHDAGIFPVGRNWFATVRKSGPRVTHHSSTDLSPFRNEALGRAGSLSLLQRQSRLCGLFGRAEYLRDETFGQPGIRRGAQVGDRKLCLPRPRRNHNRRIAFARDRATGKTRLSAREAANDPYE